MHFRLFPTLVSVLERSRRLLGGRILNEDWEQVWYVRKILLCNRSDGLCSLFEYAPEQRSYGLTSNEDTVKKLNIPNDVLEGLEKIVSSECLMDKSKQDTIRRLTEGSPCCVCL